LDQEAIGRGPSQIHLQHKDLNKSGRIEGWGFGGGSITYGDIGQGEYICN
jgi:hypothetical protein